MITKIRINELEAKKTPDAKAKGFDVVFNVEDVKVEKDEVNIKFAYAANYKGNAGHIRIRGEMTAKEDGDTIKRIQEEVKGKRMPAEYMQKIVNTVNYFGTTNATVVATVMNMVPPIKMPTLQFRQAEKKAE